MQSLKIIGLSVFAAILYGIIHDQVTARVCLEYFTVYHPHILDTESPTVLALVWGVLATWWVGAPLGILLALAARAGKRPKLNARDLVPTLAVLLLLMAAFATLFGILGYNAHGMRSNMNVYLVPMSHQMENRFWADVWAHSVSYLAGIVGGIIVCIRTWQRRDTPLPHVTAAA